MGRRSLLSVAVAASLTVAGAGVALAAPTALPDGCTQSERTVTCSYGPGESTFTAPAGVTSLQVRVAGAEGGDGNSFSGPRAPGGEGSLLTGSLAYGGGSLRVVVGAEGAVSSDNGVGGAGGSGYGPGASGGRGNEDLASGGGGGGGSAVLDGGSALVVAGAGGGGGGQARVQGPESGGAGGGGAAPGGRGDGETTAAGGALGAGSGTAGGPGNVAGGGGGGGGLPGGGGGSGGLLGGAGGGAGGGDLIPTGIARTGTNPGTGFVSISYTVAAAPVATTVSVRGGGTLTAGDGQRYSVAVDARATAEGAASGRFALSGGGADTTAGSRTITSASRTATGGSVSGTAVTAAGKQVPFTLTVVDRVGSRDQVTVRIGGRTVSGTLTNGDITSS